MLARLLGHGLPELRGRDGVAVWGQDFLFAVESATPPTVSIDKQPPIVGSSIGSTAFNSGNTYPSTYDALGRRFAASARIRF